jgi:hypothetical protein
MPVWSGVLALNGFRYHGTEKSASIMPRINMGVAKFSCFWSAAPGWGTFTHAADSGRRRVTLAVAERSLPSREVTLAAGPAGAPSAMLNGRPLAVALSHDAAASRDAGAPIRDAAASRDAGAPIRDTAARSPDTVAPNQDPAPPNRDPAPPNRDPAPPNRDTAAPSHNAAAPNPDSATPNQDRVAPNQDRAAPNRESAAPNHDNAAPNRDSAKQSHDREGVVLRFAEDITIHAGEELVLLA